jgi:nucleotide-binding universal stress UspA family protein
MTVRVLQTGLDPDLIDFTSPDFAAFPGLTREKLRTANGDNVAALRAAGYAVDNILIDSGATAVEVIRDAIKRTAYDAVLIGAGVRLIARNTLLFESLINLVHAELPGARFVFNSAPQPTPDDIRRWFDGPEATAPYR